MNNEHFNMVISHRLQTIFDLFEKKQKEYALKHPLHNFSKASLVSGKSMAEVWYGYFLKHYVSLLDIINGDIDPTKELVDEKITDMIVYLLLFEHIIEEEKLKRGE